MEEEKDKNKMREREEESGKEKEGTFFKPVSENRPKETSLTVGRY
jgi:hypothetical protein